MLTPDLTFGQTIRWARYDKKLTLDQLAPQAGISKSYLHYLETDKKKKPNVDIISRLAKALNVPYMHLLVKAGYVEEKHVKEYVSYIRKRRR